MQLKKEWLLKQDRDSKVWEHQNELMKRTQDGPKHRMHEKVVKNGGRDNGSHSLKENKHCIRKVIICLHKAYPTTLNLCRTKATYPSKKMIKEKKNCNMWWETLTVHSPD